MKILGLLRHAKSDNEDMAKRDFDRGLNERGRRGARLMGDHVRGHGIAWQQLLASPAERVRQTLATALPELEPAFDSRLYLAPGETILEVIRDHAGQAVAETGQEPDTVLVAAHNPGLQEVLLDLVAPAKENALFDEAAAKYPTATFAVLECDIERWSDLQSGCARLVHFKRPRDLDPELGPEY